ncbi:MAG: SurA N-terminal domain-containing protein [Candidatus Omnitrophota bacterium]
MIKFLRDKKIQKYIFTGLALIIIPAFALWGTSLRNQDKNDKYASALATYDGKSISLNDFYKSYRAERHLLELTYGPEALSQLEGLINIKGRAFDRILLLDYAKKHAIRASDNDVVQWLFSNPVFQNRGTFDQRVYQAYMQHLRIDARTFEEEMRQALTISKIQRGVKGGSEISDKELKTLYDRRNGQRSIAYAFVPSAADTSALKVTDEELKIFYDRVSGRLTNPTQVRFSYVSAPNRAPQADEALFADKEASLPALAQKYKLTIMDSGFIDSSSALKTAQPQPPADLIKMAMSAQAGKISDWVHLGDLSYKYEVTGKKKPGPISFEEARPMLEPAALKKKAADQAAATLEKILKDLKPENFESALSAAGIPVKTLEKFTLSGTIPEAGPSTELTARLPETPAGTVTPVFTTVNGAVAIKVLSVTAADEAAFTKEKESFKEEILSEKTAEASETLLKQLRGSLKVNNELMAEIFPDDGRPNLPRNAQPLPSDE